ncbi:MAG: hypothetical protein B193_2556 [Solidesulfovibrio magneticus str. Maddingley MBC34]|uniref:Glycosyltransferase RgtA/B/C/D-like domain-containing protein n=1 Tax=Solidesulfovibrio magneticus str. Maddingley MBC34 TaxID=1206767 RepID=K6FJJ5_9BACT|nr:MAG: hypothetical protein B193_2556 [Solidesulfovibrio magneticus str. Maddingley MBC34]
MTGSSSVSTSRCSDMQRRFADWPLWFIVIFAFVLRLLYLDQMELWWDEFVTLGRSLPNIPELLSGLMYQRPSPVSTDCSPPLHHLLVHAALQFGRGNAIIKLPSVVFSCLGIACIIGLCKRLYGRRSAAAAGIFCAISLFHFYYSRDIRWYAVYYGCSLAALYVLYRALDEDRICFWVLYGLLSALSLYASYVAAPVLVGQGMLVLVLFIIKWRSGKHGDAWRLARRFAAAMGLAFAIYSPWIPAQYYAYQSFYGKGSTNPFHLVEALKNFRFFLEYFYQGDFNKLFIALPLVGLGFASVLRSDARLGAWLILAWGIPPIAAAYLVKTEFSVSPKYVMSGFYLLAFGLGFGAEALARVVVRVLTVGRNAAGWITAIGVIAVVGSSNFNFPVFLQGKMYSDKAALRQVALAKNNIDYIFYENERNYSFVGDWYLGNLFQRASGRLARDYKRFYLLSSAHAPVPWAQECFKGAPFTGYVGGIVNRAPLSVNPDSSGTWRYTDTYRDFKLFRDAFLTDNATVSLLEGGLVPSDMSRPGVAVYAFTPADDAPFLSAKIRLKALCTKRNVFFSDASIQVLVGNSPESLFLIGHLDAHSSPGPLSMDRGYRGLYHAEGEWSVPDVLLSGGDLYVAVIVSDGSREGSVKAESLAVDFTSQANVLDVTAAARKEWAQVLANLSESERPSDGSVIVPGRLVAFTCNEDIFPVNSSVGLQSKSDRDRFLEAHPGIVPIHSVRDASGVVALELYDPWLLEPGVSLKGDAHVRMDVGKGPVGYKALGTMSPTLASFNGQLLPVSMGLPTQATAVYSRAGESFIIAREMFDEVNATPQDLYTFRDIRLRTDTAALTCMGQRPCEATYQFRSVYPLTRMVLTTYPHIFCDAGRNNYVRVSYSENGNAFKEIYTLKSNGSQEWLGTGSYPHIDAVPLVADTKEVLIKLEMSNDGAMWQSNPDAAMTFELFMNSRGMPPLASGIGELVNVPPHESAFTLSFFLQSSSAFESLRPGLTVTPFMRPFFR